MIPLVGRNMKQIEKDLFNTFAVSPSALVELAGQSAFREIDTSFDVRHVGVVAGKGNNGHDALSCARFLLNAGYMVDVYSLSQSSQLDYLKAFGAHLSLDISELKNAELIVDGMFGYGFVPPLSDNLRHVVEVLNELRCPILSLDIPSALPAEGALDDLMVHSSETVIMGLPKLNEVTGLGLINSGKLVLNDFGYRWYFYSVGADAYMVEESDAINFWKKAQKNTYHKRDAGQVTIVAGSDQFPGAAILVAKTLVYMGTGLIYISGSESVQNVIVNLIPQIIKGNGNGVYVAGPGVVEPYSCVRYLPADSIKVLDAGMLRSDILEDVDNAVITPHEGEAARLLNTTPEVVRMNRYKAAKDLFDRFGHVVVLKGPGTIIYDGSSYFVIPINEPKLSTGGTGDVLSGLIAFFLCHGLGFVEASIAAVYLHAFVAKSFTTGLDLNKFIEKLSECWWSNCDR